MIQKKDPPATTIAVISDLHLSALPNTSQEAIFDWSIQTLNQLQPDLVIFNGDATQQGRPEEVAKFLSIIQNLKIPLLITQGNTDRRSGDNALASNTLLPSNNYWSNNSIIVIPIDSSSQKISSSEQKKVALFIQDSPQKSILLATHFHPRHLDQSSQQWLNRLLKNESIDLLILGHNHRDHLEHIGNCSIHTIRGMDPDKAQGGLPTITLFRQSNETWQRDDIPFENAHPQTWASSEIKRFHQQLGYSCMAQTLEGLEQAWQHQVPTIELRADKALQVNRSSLLKSVSKWRNSVDDSYLSIHMPNLYMADNNSIKGTKLWEEAAQLALDLNAQALTIHPPRVSIASFAPGTDAWSMFTEFHLKSLEHAMELNLTLGIENLHSEEKETDPLARGYGYTPPEIINWINHLTQESSYERWGFLFDVGHAFNNRPYSEEYSLNKWCSLLGHSIVGYHIHQLEPGTTRFKNHCAIDSWFGAPISYAGILWSWKHQHINQAPMFIEIRDHEPWQNRKHLLQNTSTPQM